MVDFICKRKHQDFFCRNLGKQRTCVSNSMALTLTQPKLLALKILAVCAWLCKRVCKGEGGEREGEEYNFSKISLGITCYYEWLFMKRFNKLLKVYL